MPVPSCVVSTSEQLNVLLLSKVREFGNFTAFGLFSVSFRSQPKRRRGDKDHVTPLSQSESVLI